MDTTPVTARSLGKTYFVDGDNLERTYRDVLSGYTDDPRQEELWKWNLHVSNMGIHLGIDETKIGHYVYTILINKEGHGGRGTIIAYCVSTKIKDVSEILLKIPEELRNSVVEVTMDFSDSMRGIVRKCFPKAKITIDCFHVVKLLCDALEEIRLRSKRDAVKEVKGLEAAFHSKLKRNARRRTAYKAKHPKKTYKGKKRGRKPVRVNAKFLPPTMGNGETLIDMISHAKAQLMESGEKWNDKQKDRGPVLFKKYPKIQECYSLICSFRAILRNKTLDADSAKVKLHEWYDKVAKSTIREIKAARDIIKEREDDVLNYFNERSSNAASESLNSKIKKFRAQVHGVRDDGFFMYRVMTIFG